MSGTSKAISTFTKSQQRHCEHTLLKRNWQSTRHISTLLMIWIIYGKVNNLTNISTK